MTVMVMLRLIASAVRFNRSPSLSRIRKSSLSKGFLAPAMSVVFVSVSWSIVWTVSTAVAILWASQMEARLHYITLNILSTDELRYA